MSLLIAFLLTAGLILLLKKFAVHVKLVDVPGGRKVHDGTVPVTGGVAMFAGFLLPALFLDAATEPSWEFSSGLLLLLLIGVVDDTVGLGAWTKLGGQTAVAALLVIPGHHLIGIGDFIGSPVLRMPQADLALTIVFIVGAINAFNMIDGLDGLAGGAAASGLLWLAIIGWLAGMRQATIQALLLLSAVLGFLVFNVRHPWRRRAFVFMGDSGSMVLGAAIAFFTIDLASGPDAAAPLPALLWGIALPLFDTLLLIGRRLALGESPLRADRRHLHHLLLAAGVSPHAASAVLVAICLALGGIGLGGWLLGLSPVVLLLGLALPFTFHAWFVLYGWKLIGRAGHKRRAHELLTSVELFGDAGE